MTDDRLLAALAAIQARGAIGTTQLTDAVRHAERFVALISGEARTLVDLGSGGGLPGLVIADRCPRVAVTLVERRTSRADLLRRAVAALECGDRVVVLTADVASLAGTASGSFDVATARSFAAPAVTARWGGALLRQGGVLLVSEPPDDRPGRWSDAVLTPAGLVDEGILGGVRRLRRV